ncbi:MAG: cobalamin-dependent protein [Myxococcales bacterium]|nr:cobalamin-dependent protein [Myxococcales bacterium]
MTAMKKRSPWIIRTYAGFGDATESNQRFRDNLARGQRGLSVAFDLPTQCGLDADDPLARGEVGQTGVSVAHLGDMRDLFDELDLSAVNTSLTINATAPWLYAMYLALADERGVPRQVLRGTTQNDLLKEFVARGTYVFSPDVSFRLSTDLVVAAMTHTPKWNPTNCCGYHLMESGAGPEEEVGYALLGALFVLEAVRPKLDDAAFERVVNAISFFINSGIELVPEIAKVRAYAKLWPDLCEERYGLRPRWRAGCQVRSLSLAAKQPEINIVRIALSAMPVLISANARVGALQLPGFREALGLPDEAEQVLSLRTQQVWMHETGIADYPDIFEGSVVIEGETSRIEQAARDIIDAGLTQGYTATIEGLAGLLSERMAQWQQGIESGTQVMVGVNRFGEALPVARESAAAMPTPSDEIERARIAELQSWRAARDESAWSAARETLIAAARDGSSLIEPSVQFAKAGGTTGEWTKALHTVFGPRYAAPLGVSGSSLGSAPTRGHEAGRRRRVLLAKAGLDGHVNALRLLAVALRQAGFEVVYAGPAQTPDAIAHAAVSEAVDVIGVSSLSGAHLWVAGALQAALSARNAEDIPVVMGGILPPDDHAALTDSGVRALFGPGTPLPEIIAALTELSGAATSPIG